MATRDKGKVRNLRAHQPSDPSYVIAVAYCLGGIVMGIISAIKESPWGVIAALLAMAFGIRELIRTFRDNVNRHPPDDDAQEFDESPNTDSDSLPDDSDCGTTDTGE